MAMKKSEFKDCDIYAARIAALRPFPKETLKSLMKAELEENNGIRR